MKQCITNCSLLPHNTFGIDVRAARFLEYDSEDELLSLIHSRCITSPYLHIGQGSNLLFLGDYDGTILHSAIKGITVVGEDRTQIFVRVGAGVLWDDFVACCVDRQWYGAENLSWIPGEVGAAAVQNIGAYGVEVKDLITQVEGIDLEGKRHRYVRSQCGYAYRDSVFKRPDMKSLFITYVYFALDKQPHYQLDYGTIRQELQAYDSWDVHTLRQVIIDIRRRKLPDPKQWGNAGSFFKNPFVSKDKYESLVYQYGAVPHYEAGESQVKIPAAWLIEQCGWKGKSLGPAAVHDRQALVLVNKGGATGADVLALSDAVRDAVRRKFEIEIHPEVNIIRCSQP